MRLFRMAWGGLKRECWFTLCELPSDDLEIIGS